MKNSLKSKLIQKILKDKSENISETVLDISQVRENISSKLDILKQTLKRSLKQLNDLKEKDFVDLVSDNSDTDSTLTYIPSSLDKKSNDKHSPLDIIRRLNKNKECDSQSSEDKLISLHNNKKTVNCNKNDNIDQEINMTEDQFIQYDNIEIKIVDDNFKEEQNKFYINSRECNDKSIKIENFNSSDGKTDFN